VLANCSNWKETAVVVDLRVLSSEVRRQAEQCIRRREGSGAAHPEKWGAGKQSSAFGRRWNGYGMVENVQERGVVALEGIRDQVRKFERWKPFYMKPYQEG
jgi:hypothetical protein